MGKSSLQMLLDAQEAAADDKEERSYHRSYRHDRRTTTRESIDHIHRDDGRKQTSNNHSRWAAVEDLQSKPFGRWRINSKITNNKQIESKYSRHGREPSYDERRAKIERYAIHQARGGPLLQRNNQKEFQGYDDDIATWIGPLINGSCTYYQDRSKKYPFYCKLQGYKLLQTLMEENAALLQINAERIQEAALERVCSSCKKEEHVNLFQEEEIVKNIGKGLYSDKPTLRTKGVTWSTEEYSHPGLQRMYLRMKSIQRFTEIYSLLERSANIGVFNDIFQRGSSKVRIAAIGGGPGYELFAAKLFFQKQAPDLQLEFICMDVCAAWRPYAEQFGFQFVEYDIHQEGVSPLDVAGLKHGDLDFCIVSCVMIYVTNNQTLDMLYNLVHNDGLSAILLSERGEKTKACKMMEERGGCVIRIIDQTNGVDERQAVLCSTEFKEANNLEEGLLQHQRNEFTQTFPNVPFEEHKQHRSSNRLSSFD